MKEKGDVLVVVSIKDIKDSAEERGTLCSCVLFDVIPHLILIEVAIFIRHRVKLSQQLVELCSRHCLR